MNPYTMNPYILQDTMEEDSTNNLLVVLIMLVVIITTIIIVLYIFKDQLRKLFKKPTTLDRHVSEKRKEANNALQDLGIPPLPPPPKCPIKPTNGVCRSSTIKYKDENGDDCCKIPEQTAETQTVAQERLEILKAVGELGKDVAIYETIIRISKHVLLKNSKIARNIQRKGAEKAFKKGDKKAIEKRPDLLNVLFQGDGEKIESKGEEYTLVVKQAKLNYYSNGSVGHHHDIRQWFLNTYPGVKDPRILLKLIYRLVRRFLKGAFLIFVPKIGWCVAGLEAGESIKMYQNAMSLSHQHINCELSEDKLIM